MMIKTAKTGLLCLFVASLLSGCATSERYEEILNTYIGADEDELIEHWGVPDQVYETDKTRFLVYKRSRISSSGGVPPTYYSHINPYTGAVYTQSVGGIAPQIQQYRCKTTFGLKDGKVASWQWQGNDCVAY